MRFVLAYCHRDWNLAIGLFRWMAQLDGRTRHPCLLVASAGLSQATMNLVHKSAQDCFEEVQTIKPNRQDERGWPMSCNLKFRTAVNYLTETKPEPFFWNDPDAIPLKPRWLDLLESEYHSKTKPFMGCVWDTPSRHMNGIAVYPADVKRYNPEMLKADRLPWDMASPEITLTHCHHTELIQHEWGDVKNNIAPTFPTVESLERISSRAVVYHRSKDLSLISRLSERLQSIRQVSILPWRKAAPQKPLKISLLYIHVAGDQKHINYAKQFVASYKANPPGAEHSTLVICQGGPARQQTWRLFDGLPNLSFFEHDDSGWDIGGFIAASKNLDCDMVVCCGGSAFMQNPGWMARMVESWRKHGEGFYAANSTYEVSPHLNTCGFWCSPRFLARYPLAVTCQQHRYDFEHGPNAAWKIASQKGMPAKLVTWCGEYDWPEWRKPPNIFRRGDQSNCLICWHHHSKYSNAANPLKRAMENNTNTIIDPLFNGDVKFWRGRLSIHRKSAEMFIEAHQFNDKGERTKQ